MPEDTSEKQLAKTTPDEVALELMKFIAVTTGYGKGTSTAGFGGKAPRTSEEYADSLLELFERCRAVVRKTK
jgi:ATP:corrinoid adenosyltransferase